MKISLIIAYYKNISALSLIFKALENQSYNDFEVIVAEDDNDEETLKFVTEKKEKSLFPVKHLQHQKLRVPKLPFHQNAVHQIELYHQEVVG